MEGVGHATRAQPKAMCYRGLVSNDGGVLNAISRDLTAAAE
jgi:hypothetical protein